MKINGREIIGKRDWTISNGLPDNPVGEYRFKFRNEKGVEIFFVLYILTEKEYLLIEALDDSVKELIYNDLERRK